MKQLLKRISPQVWITALIALVAIVLPFLWLHPGEMLLDSDILAPLDPAHNYGRVFSLWDPTNNAGTAWGAGLYLPRWFLWLIPFTADKIGLSQTTGEALMFGGLLAGWVVAASFLLRSLNITKIGFFLGLLFALFNPFIVDRAHDMETLTTLIMSAYMSGAIIRVAQGSRIPWYALGFALIQLILPVANPSTRIAGLLLPLIIFFSYLWRSRSKERKSLLQFGLLTIGLTLLINGGFLYALSTFFQGEHVALAQSGAQSWLSGVSESASLWNIVRLIGAWDWFQTFSGEAYIPVAQFYQTPLGIGASVTPLVLIGGLALWFRRWTLWHTIIVVGVILAMGTHPPFGGVFQWAFDHLPGFSIFRSPWYKFSIWILIGFIVLIGRGFDTFKKMGAPRAVIGLALCAGALIIASGWPLFTGGRYARTSERQALSAQRVKIPAYAREAAGWIRSHTKGGRVLLVPQHRFDSSQMTWGYGSITPVQNALFDPVPVIYQNFIPGEGESRLLDLFEKHLAEGDRGASGILEPLGVEFIVLQKDFSYRNFNLADQTTFYRDLLRGQKDITPAADFGEWEIFSVAAGQSKASFAPYAAQLVTESSDEMALTQTPNMIFTSETNPALNETALLFGRWGLGEMELFQTTVRVRAPNLPAASYTVKAQGSLGGLTLNGQPIAGAGTAAIGAGAVIEGTLAGQTYPLKNTDFSTGTDWTVINETGPGSFENRGSEGALTVGGGHITLFQTLSSFDITKHYLATVRYKTDGGAVWKIGIRQSGPAPRYEELKSGGEYQTKTFWVPVDSAFVQAQLEFIGDGSGTLILDDLTLAEVENTTALTITPEVSISSTALTLERQSNTRYIIRGAATRGGVVALDEAYSTGWKAYEGATELFHFRANGFANGWKVPHDGPFEITIEYAPQRVFVNIIIVSALLILMLCGLLLFRSRIRFLREVRGSTYNKPWWVDKSVLIILIAAALVPLLWFRQNTIITGADINFPLDPVARFANRLFAWGISTNGGADQSSLFSSLVFHGVQALFAAPGFALIWVERLELVFWNALLGISFFIFIRELVGKRWTIAALAATCFWLFNPYRIVMWTETNVATLAASVALPLFLWTQLRVFRARLSPHSGGVLIGIILLLGSGMGLNPPVMVLALGTVLLFYLGGLVRVWRTKSARARWILFGLFTLFWSGVFNLFWILPFIWTLMASAQTSSGLGGFQLLNWVEGLSRDTSFWNVLRLQGAWDWYQNYKSEPYIPYAHIYRENLGLIAISILPFALSIFGLLYTRRRWWIGFAFALIVVGVVFGMGVHGGARAIFGWAGEHIPGFWMFRSPWYKFTLLTTLGYGIGIAFALVALKRFIRSAAIYNVSVLAIAGLFITFGFPLLTGSLFPTKTERHELNNFHVDVPSYIFEASRWLNEQPREGKVMFLPKEVAYNYTWGYGSAGDVTLDLIQRPIVTPLTFSAQDDSFSAGRLIDLAYEYLYEGRREETRTILNTLNVSYLLHKNDSRYDFYQNTDSPDFVRERLAIFPEIKRVQTFGEWDIYAVARDGARSGVVADGNTAVIIGGTNDFASGLYLSERAQAAPRFYASLEDIPVQTLARSDTLLSFADPTELREKENALELTLAAPKDATYNLFAQGAFRTPFTMTLNGQTFSSAQATKLEANWYALGAVELPAGTHTTTIKNLVPSQNLLKNGGFDDFSQGTFPNWESKDCDVDASGTAIFDLQQGGGPDGSSAATVRAKGHVQCLTQKITQDFYPDAIYKLSFDYRALEGAPPQYTVWQQGPQAPRPKETFSSSKEWMHFETVFKPEVSTQSLELFFYADGRLGHSAASYDNVRLIRLSDSFTSIALASQPSATTPEEPRVTLVSQNPTKVVFDITGATQKTVVALTTGFAPGWQATILTDRGLRRVASDDHFVYAGYANGWQLKESGAYRVTLTYGPQRLFLIGIFLTALGLLTAAGMAIRHRRAK
jgi:hypothetical protein